MTFHMSPFPHSLPLTLLLILTQLMLVVPSLQLKFSRYTFGRNLSVAPPHRHPFFSLLLTFILLPEQEDNNKGN